MKTDFTKQEIASMSLPKIDEWHPMPQFLIPALMNSADLIAIARHLCLYKNNELLSNQDDEILLYAKSWVKGLMKRKDCSQLAKVDFSNDHLMYLSMSELEYLINHEIIARQVYSETHENDPNKFFDVRRLSRFSSDFLSQQLRSKGFELIARTDLLPNMESIFELIERRPDLF